MRWLPPRKASDVFKIAARINPLLPRLLPECGDLKSARNELRWMKEHIANLPQPPFTERNQRIQLQAIDGSSNALLENYVRRRSRGEPLQYILGTQPFGDLEILCKPQVLIPRTETETYTTILGEKIKTLEGTDFFSNRKEYGPVNLRIVDYCTGSGCIALLLHSILRSTFQSAEESTIRYQISGQDESVHALALAKENKDHNINRGVLNPIAQKEVQFSQIDVLGFARAIRAKIPELYPSVLSRDALPLDLSHQDNQKFGKFNSVLSKIRAASICEAQDIVVANPPYIKSSDFGSGGTVTFSVRQYEPQKALLPPPPNDQEAAILERFGCDVADVFYLALIDIAVASQAKLLVMEIGDNDQAQRIRNLVRQRINQIHGTVTSHVFANIETWRDDGKIVVGDITDRRKEASEAGFANDRAIVVKFGPGWEDAEIHPGTRGKMQV